MNQNVTKLVKLIDAVLKRPGMYQVNKVEDIHYILLGYRFCETDASVNNFLSEFRKYVNSEFNNQSDVDWCRIIRFHSSEDSHSLELFGKVFKSFAASRKVS